MDRRAGGGRRARRLGCRRGQDRAPGRRPGPPVRPDARRRPALQPRVRARQPGQAQHRAGPHDAGRSGCRARPPRCRRRVRDERPRRRAGAPRPRRRDVAGAQPAPGLRAHHRLRPGGSRCGQGGLRHRRVLVARRHRPPADGTRREAAVPARRDGRPQHRIDVRRRHLRRAVPPREDRRGPARLVVAVPPGRVHGQLRPQHGPRVGPLPGDRDARDDAQPVRQQLPGGLWPALLDRRPRGRPPLAADRPPRRPPRVARRPALRHRRSTGPCTPAS